MNSGRLPGERVLICGAGAGGAATVAGMLAALECRTLLVDHEPPHLTPAASDAFAGMVAVDVDPNVATSARRGKHHGRHAGAFGGSKS